MPNSIPSNPLSEMRRGLADRRPWGALAVAVCVLGGILVPLPNWGMDVSLIINLCLAAALVLIGWTARQAAELSALPGLLTLATTIRIISHVSATRMIYLEGYGGMLLSLAGGVTAALQSPWIRVIWPIVAGMALLSIVQTARRIQRTTMTFTEEIQISRELAIHTRYRKGQMDRDSAELSRQALDRETVFYRGIASAFNLLRIEGVVVMLTLGFLCIGFGGSSIREAEKVLSDPRYLSLLTAAAVMSITPELLIAMAFRRLAGVLTADWPKEISGQPIPAEKITIISRQSGQAEEVELLNPDFRETSRETMEATLSRSDSEQVASFEPAGVAHQKIRPPEEYKARYSSMDDYYVDLCGTVRQAGKMIMMAAAELAHLPVTVAVNTAIRLAKDGETVLMINAEPGRNAIAEVFDLQESSGNNMAAASCIANLSIWLGREFVEGKPDHLTNLAAQYQRILIYAPQILTLSSGTDLARLTDQVILFGPAEPQNRFEEIQTFLHRTATIFVSPAGIA